MDRIDLAGFEPVAGQMREQMRALETADLFPYRMENGGNYQVPRLELRPELGDAGAFEFALRVDQSTGRASADRSDSSTTRKIIKLPPSAGRTIGITCHDSCRFALANALKAQSE